MGETVEHLALARELVLRFGHNETAYQILNPGIRFWFSTAQDAVVGYADWKNIRLVAGAPICDSARLTQVVDEFEKQSFLENKCSVCFFAAGTQLEKILTAPDRYSRILLGSQPVWFPERWAKILMHRASLRAQLNRARNKGVSVQEWPPSQAAMDQNIHRCLSEWIAERPIPSMHFLVEPNTLDRLWDRRIFVAEKNSIPVGFLIATPIPSRKGWLIEQIIRGNAAPNGTAELLLDKAFKMATEEKWGYITLGLSPLSLRLINNAELKNAALKKGQTYFENPLWIKALFFVTRNYGNRFYNFRGLENFKSKFEPDEWEPIYAIYNRAKFSPRVLMAFASVFGGRPLFVVVLSALFRRFFVSKTTNGMRMHF